MLLEDANDVLEMAVTMKRIIPADKWVEDYLVDAELSTLNRI